MRNDEINEHGISWRAAELAAYRIHGIQDYAELSKRQAKIWEDLTPKNVAFMMTMEVGNGKAGYAATEELLMYLQHCRNQSIPICEEASKRVSGVAKNFPKPSNSDVRRSLWDRVEACRIIVEGY